MIGTSPNGCLLLLPIFVMWCGMETRDMGMEEAHALYGVDELKGHDLLEYLLNHYGVYNALIDGA
ncbi:hypothetical protein Csa_021436 [Cucumis sativus]|uniref:Uncharacterized protein n=1 Tax=Cucumis sativus TaxID=3659 RepID=A0A0A0KS86_CUCSA|nr:hypothetical protein Csa_021436 [Cucumis sativus]